MLNGFQWWVYHSKKGDVSEGCEKDLRGCGKYGEPYCGNFNATSLYIDYILLDYITLYYITLHYIHYIHIYIYTCNYLLNI